MRAVLDVGSATIFYYIGVMALEMELFVGVP